MRYSILLIILLSCITKTRYITNKIDNTCQKPALSKCSYVTDIKSAGVCIVTLQENERNLSSYIRCLEKIIDNSTN